MLDSVIRQHESAISVHMPPPSWTSLHTPPHPAPLACPRVLPWALGVIPWLPTSYFTYDNAYVSMLLSRFIPPSSSPTVSKVCSLCLHLYFLPCKYVHLYHFSRFHKYALKHNICFSFWLTSLCITGCRFSHLSRPDLKVFLLWLSNIISHIRTTASLAIHLLMDIYIASMS